MFYTEVDAARQMAANDLEALDAPETFAYVNFPKAVFALSRCSLVKFSWKVNPSLATAVNALATASTTFERRFWRRFCAREDVRDWRLVSS